MAIDIKIYVGDSSKSHAAIDFAKSHGMCLTTSIDSDGLFLIYGRDRLELLLQDNREQLRLHADFIDGSAAHRRLYGGGKNQLIGKALGINKGFKPRVLDATAGLGRDAFVMATLGATVILCERCAVVHLILHDALSRAESYALDNGDAALLEIIKRMTLIYADSNFQLPTAADCAEVIYLDPMFPERKKSALVKKEMRIFHQLVGEDDDSADLLEIALAHAVYRVVVKRPKIAPYLANAKPNYQLVGKSSRFDIYTKRALPV